MAEPVSHFSAPSVVPRTTDGAEKGIIPFYGAQRPDLFAIERAAMDRAGRVIAALDALVAPGLVLDVGAGTGFTAHRLTRHDRTVVAAEPSRGMHRPEVPVPWVGAQAEALPFASRSFDGAYATWAYFFSRHFDCGPGLAELHRVVRPGGPLVIVDNAGGDEFSALAGDDITADPAFWAARGFACHTVDTAFEFASVDDAGALLTLYFGDRTPTEAPLRLSYRVHLFVGVSQGA